MVKMIIDDAPRNGSAIRVLLADDHHVVRTGIREHLAQYDDIEIIGEATDGLETLAMAKELRPDVIVLDINMPKLTGVEVTERLRKTLRHSGWLPSILVLSGYCNRAYVSNLLAAGAKGYLLKGEALGQIARGIRQVVQGHLVLSLFVQKMLSDSAQHPEHNLSMRELEVLRLMAKGNTNEEIAEALVIARGTVKNHVAKIYRKLPNVSTRSDAVAWAWANQIVGLGG